MDDGDRKITQYFERFDRHATRNSYLVVAAYLLLNNSINATSEWMETTRDGTPDFALWEPFVWEYSSAIVVLLLLPLLVYGWRRTPLAFSGVGRQAGRHLLMSLGFSLLHVLFMVALRQFIYWLAGDEYRFGNWPREFIYEYRKDAWGYVAFFMGYELYHYVAGRMRGEASWIDDDPEVLPQQTIPEHFLVKKLDREFLVRVEDIEWLEAAGNYVNLHCAGRIYPLRATLAELSERLVTRGFSRIHRSLAVNHRAIEHISYLPSGDGEIKLRMGKVLALSRRYKEQFKQRLG